MEDILQAGFSKRDITPPAGQPMGAFPASRRPMQARLAEGVHDPLYGRALAISDNKTAVVICAADVVTFQWVDVDRMRADFAKRTGLSPDSFIISGTHNHNGPECTYHFGGDPDDRYIAEMRTKIVDAAVDAYNGMQPANVSTGIQDADIAYNRREIRPDDSFVQRNKNLEGDRIGPVDPRVSVLRFDSTDGGSIASVIHFAAHPVILSTPNLLFTAEYPGATLRHFETQTGVSESLFLQGACGDTHPFQALSNDYDGVEEMGQSLGEAAAAAWGNASQESDVSVDVERWIEDLPNRYSSELKVHIEIPALRLSNRLALVFWPGEPFIEMSLALQWRSPFARTVVVGHALGSCGYVPTLQAYEYGGYGVDRYPVEQDPAELNRARVMPGTGERFIDETSVLLGRLKR